MNSLSLSLSITRSNLSGYRWYLTFFIRSTTPKFNVWYWLTYQNLLWVVKVLCAAVMALSGCVFASLQVRKNSLFIKGLWIKFKSGFVPTAGARSGKGR